jgi:transposase
VTPEQPRVDPAEAARVQALHYDLAREWVLTAQEAWRRSNSAGYDVSESITDLGNPIYASAAAQIAQVHIALGDRASRHTSQAD